MRADPRSRPTLRDAVARGLLLTLAVLVIVELLPWTLLRIPPTALLAYDPAAEGLLDWTEAELMGKVLHDVIH